MPTVPDNILKNSDWRSATEALRKDYRIENTALTALKRQNMTTPSESGFNQWEKKDE